MDTETYDYSQDDRPAVGENALAQLAGLAQEQAEAEAEVARLEAELEKAKKVLRIVSEETLPGLMDELKLQQFTTTNGFRIEVKKTMRASITKEREERAFGWLEDNGHAALIKRQVVVQFGRKASENKLARAMLKRLDRVGRDAAYKRKVEPATLAAFLREQMANGREIPLELFGAFEQRSTKITRG